MLNEKRVIFAISVVLISITLLSCQLEKTCSYEDLVKEFTLGNIQGIIYKYDQDEFGIKAEHTLKPLLEFLKYELTNSNDLGFCINKITHHVDSILLEHSDISGAGNQYDFYNSIFLLNKQLKNKRLDKAKKYQIINKLISFIALEERDGSLYHYPHKIILYFEDTIYLARNNEYTFPMAILHDHKGRGRQMNMLDRDTNYDDKQITISTYNQKSVMKERINFTLYDPISEEEYTVKDTLVIKILD